MLGWRDFIVRQPGSLLINSARSYSTYPGLKPRIEGGVQIRDGQRIERNIFGDWANAFGPTAQMKAIIRHAASLFIIVVL